MKKTWVTESISDTLSFRAEATSSVVFVRFPPDVIVMRSSCGMCAWSRLNGLRVTAVIRLKVVVVGYVLIWLSRAPARNARGAKNEGVGHVLDVQSGQCTLSVQKG